MKEYNDQTLTDLDRPTGQGKKSPKRRTGNKPPDTGGAVYIDHMDCYAFVSSGISHGAVRLTVRQKMTHGGTHRIKSPKLPIRDTKAEAQRDLDEYAKAKGWKLWKGDNSPPESVE